MVSWSGARRPDGHIDPTFRWGMRTCIGESTRILIAA